MNARRIAGLVALCLLAFATCFSASAVEPSETEGGVRWHGANVRLATFAPGSDAYCPGAFDELAKLGVNVVRLTGASVIGQYDMGIPFEPDMLEDFLREADEREIKTIFLLGGLYPYVGAIQENPFRGELAESLRVAAVEIVERFAGDERILMWDLMNEPNVADAELMTFLEELAACVKEVDPTHPITIGGWSNDSSGMRIPDEPADSAEIAGWVDVYSPHKYFGKRMLPADPGEFFRWTDQRLYDWVYEYYTGVIEQHKTYANGKPIVLQEFAGAGPFENVVAEVGHRRAEVVEAVTFRAALQAIWDSGIEGATFWAFVPYSPSFEVRSAFTYDRETGEYAWREAGYVIQEYFKSPIASSEGSELYF